MQAALEVLRTRGIERIDAALVFGSGLGSVAKALWPGADIVPYREIPGMPPPVVGGHLGELHVARVGGRTIAAFLGRAHLYEGRSAADAVFNVRLAAALGARTIVLTNAAGSVAADLHPGDVLLIRDQINLTGCTPLLFSDGLMPKPDFVPMVDAYDPALRSAALGHAHGLGLTLREGIYAGVLGPAYETPAEVAMLRAIGADAVGMSTVLECIAGRALGLRCAGLSVITNAAGTGGGHAEVLQAAEAGAERLCAILGGGWFV